MTLHVADGVIVIKTNSYDDVGPGTALDAAISWLRERGVPVLLDDRDTGTL